MQVHCPTCYINVSPYTSGASVTGNNALWCKRDQKHDYIHYPRSVIEEETPIDTCFVPLYYCTIVLLYYCTKMFPTRVRIVHLRVRYLPQCPDVLHRYARASFHHKTHTRAHTHFTHLDVAPFS